MYIKNPKEKLFEAIDAKDNQRVLALIVFHGEMLNAANERGLTPLMDAVISKNYDAMRLLILHGVDVNHRDPDGWTAKSWAIFIQDREAQRILSKASVVSHSDDISGAVFGSMAF